MSLSNLFTDFIPQTAGYLPKWQLFIAATSLFNTIQNLVSLKLTKRLYGGSPLVNPLQARTFAIWTLTTTIVRGYAAYNLHIRQIYDIAFLTYFLAFFHFTSETMIFRSVRFSGPMVFPFLVSTGTLVWMFVQRDFYVTA
ncbi:ergosterol biosynthesis protein [Marasmius crinis-equi]|uniref:Ergosterol biosynthesis protein n=1 Tax=Marasmius crinis-equi TaxID=585013 RepID=A0ABR3EYV7_9AGAR